MFSCSLQKKLERKYLKAFLWDFFISSSSSICVFSEGRHAPESVVVLYYALARQQLSDENLKTVFFFLTTKREKSPPPPPTSALHRFCIAHCCTVWKKKERIRRCIQLLYFISFYSTRFKIWLPTLPTLQRHWDFSVCVCWFYLLADWPIINH